MDTDSEIFMIHAAQGGSEKAWRQLFERHFDAVYRFCLALTGARHDVAEELTQQVFVIAARRIYRFDPRRAAFRAWLFGIAKNRHLAIRAGWARRKRHEEASAKWRSEAATPVDHDLCVHEALARLPSHYRIVLEAKYLKGLTMNEIAESSRASVEAIESLLRRARTGFAREYEQIRALDR
jgi:RNA polymerase sigma-70 factor (ECF subfamily)